MSDNDDYVPDADILPDDLLDRHLGKSTAVADPEPEAEDDPEDDDSLDDDTSEEDIDEEEEEDEGEDEAGAEDPDEELDDEEEDDEEDKDEDGEKPESVLERVTPEDRERIEKDPALKKLHKLMQGDYTRKTMALARRDREVEEREEQVAKFESAVSTPEGMAGYIARTFELHPEVIASAFEAVATHKDADPLGFLVEVGLYDPETFEKAYERVQELQSDPDAKKQHERARDDVARSKRLDEKEQRIRRQTFDSEWKSLERKVTREAARLGIEKDDIPEVVDRLKARVRGKVRPDGSIALGGQDVRTIAKEAKAALDKAYERVSQRLRLKQEAESRERTKKKAREAATKPRRVPPKDAARRRPKDKVPWKAPEGADPLDAFVDFRLSD